MITTAIGQRAEKLVADYLAANGWKILDKNWRRLRCEIDIIARKDKIIHFVEVKFRSSDLQGDGLEYITPKKLKQIQFAAKIWNQENNWDGDCRILAVSVEYQNGRMLIKDIVDVVKD